MTQQVLSDNQGKPLVGSWRAKIRSNRGFQMLVEEILQLIPSQGKEIDEKIRERVMDNCETLWKLSAAEQCGKSKNLGVRHDYTVFHKKIENEAVLDSKSEPVNIIEKEKEKETKNKSRKTRKKSCDC